MGITSRFGVEVVMAENAVQLRLAEAPAEPSENRVVDIRTGKPWRPPEARTRPFLLDITLTSLLVVFGAWLFLKMQGG